MPSWKFQRGENALYEGTVLVATVQGQTATPYDLTGATLYLHFGSQIGSPMKSWTSGGSSLSIVSGTVGIWRFEWYPEDTEGLSLGSYYYDLWLRTTTNKEYALTLGTLTILPVVGTI